VGSLTEGRDSFQKEGWKSNIHSCSLHWLCQGLPWTILFPPVSVQSMTTELANTLLLSLHKICGIPKWEIYCSDDKQLLPYIWCAKYKAVWIYTLEYWVSGLHPSSCLLKEHISETGSVSALWWKGREAHTQLGLLELIYHWATQEHSSCWLLAFKAAQECLASSPDGIHDHIFVLLAFPV
jgi:hypothetical protein